MNGMLRWFKFNLVGLGGALVQLGLIEAWMHFSLGNYLLGTMVAVEATLLHNFGWHCAYTWRDRRAQRMKTIVARAVRFQVSNGAVSMVGNLVLMRVLVSALRAPVLVANLVAIVVCSTANFFLGDRFVFGDAVELRRSG
ncbi:MAG TPA: GtrA family protein [Candidatus Koribacter sp.]|jgi:putative flippase GtrA